MYLRFRIGDVVVYRSDESFHIAIGIVICSAYDCDNDDSNVGFCNIDERLIVATNLLSDLVIVAASSGKVTIELEVETTVARLLDLYQRESLN